MAEGALNCFTTLLESIPGWIAELEEIVHSVTERQQDILRENQPVDSHQDQARNPSKSSSVLTRISRESEGNIRDALQSSQLDESMPTLVQTQLPHMTQSDALRLSQRKRKTASVCSDRLSGPLKYRSRSMVVIYYDGEIQKRFENIVRAIGSRRNALRKGRTSAQVYELSRNGSSSSEGSSGDDSGACVPKVAYRSARTRQSPASGAQSEELAIFDQLDGFLDKAQAQCERAAYQVLRDGDCGMEIQAARERFGEVETRCASQLPIWRKRIEGAAERERWRADDEEEKKPPPAYYSTDGFVDDPFTEAAPLEVDIEPDDSDGGGEGGRGFTINMMQLGRPRPYVRDSRVTAH